MTVSFYTEEELKTIGIKRYGKNVLISRNAMIYSPELLELGNNVRIDDFCVISGKVVLGDYIHIAAFCGLYGGKEGIYMEDFSTISSKGSIYAVSDDYSGKSMTNPMVPEKYKIINRNASVKIGKHVIIGCMSVVLPGVQIGEGTSIGAMTLCNKSIGEFGIYAGIPAKRIKERNRDFLDLAERMKKEIKSKEKI